MNTCNLHSMFWLSLLFCFDTRNLPSKLVFTKLPWLKLSSIAHVLTTPSDPLILTLTGTTHMLIHSWRCTIHWSTSVFFSLAFSFYHLALVCFFLLTLFWNHVILSDVMCTLTVFAFPSFLAAFWVMPIAYWFAASITISFWRTPCFFHQLVISSSLHTHQCHGCLNR